MICLKKNNEIVTMGYCLYQFIIYDPINLKHMYYVTVSLGCNKGCQIPILSVRCGLDHSPLCVELKF